MHEHVKRFITSEPGIGRHASLKQALLLVTHSFICPSFYSPELVPVNDGTVLDLHHMAG